MKKHSKTPQKMDFSEKNIKKNFMFSKSSIKPYELDFFEIFLKLEITARKNTTLLILYQ